MASRKRISIHDYPEHLNPFYEEIQKHYKFSTVSAIPAVNESEQKRLSPNPPPRNRKNHFDSCEIRRSQSSACELKTIRKCRKKHSAPPPPLIKVDTSDTTTKIEVNNAVNRNIEDNSITVKTAAAADIDRTRKEDVNELRSGTKKDSAPSHPLIKAEASDTTTKIEVNSGINRNIEDDSLTVKTAATADLDKTGREVVDDLRSDTKKDSAPQTPFIKAETSVTTTKIEDTKEINTIIGDNSIKVKTAATADFDKTRRENVNDLRSDTKIYSAPPPLLTKAETSDIRTQIEGNNEMNTIIEDNSITVKTAAAVDFDKPKKQDVKELRSNPKKDSAPPSLLIKAEASDTTTKIEVNSGINRNIEDDSTTVKTAATDELDKTRREDVDDLRSDTKNTSPIVGKHEKDFMNELIKNLKETSL